MIKKTVTLTLLASILLINACSTTQTPEEESTIQPTSVTEQIQPVDADTVLDNQLFNKATSNNNVKACEEILDENKKEECSKIVQSSILTQEAINTVDITKCQKIEIERYKENCEESVTSKIEKEEQIELKQEETLEKIDKNSETNERAQNSNDPSICEELNDEGLISSCKYNVIANQAIQEKNIEKCDEIGTEELIDRCKQTVESLEE